MNNLEVQQIAENRILFVRDKEVMLDTDLAEMYNITTKDLNQRVKRNQSRFPNEVYMFELSSDEKKDLINKYAHLEKLKFSPHNPKAFTEYGVIMMSTVLDSEIAIQVCHILVDTFIKFRKSQQTIDELKHEVAQLKLDLQDQYQQFAMHFQVIFRELKELKQQNEQKNSSNPIGFLPNGIQNMND
jgi:hypothetical protein